MRILVACEYSGAVRDAFIARGHDAWSCDLLPGEGHNVHRHIQDDIRKVLSTFPGVDSAVPLPYKLPNGVTVWADSWDMLVAFPDCTYLCGSGMHWTKRGLRDPQLTIDALDFVAFLRDQPIERVAIENPVGILSTEWRKPDQYIQPYQFGHDASKKTGLWLKNLPKLQPTELIAPRVVDGRPRWSNQTDSGQNRLGPSPDRWQLRAATYSGVAKAMAEQWG